MNGCSPRVAGRFVSTRAGVGRNGCAGCLYLLLHGGGTCGIETRHLQTGSQLKKVKKKIDTLLLTHDAGTQQYVSIIRHELYGGSSMLLYGRAVDVSNIGQCTSGKT